MERKTLSNKVKNIPKKLRISPQKNKLDILLKDYSKLNKEQKQLYLIYKNSMLEKEGYKNDWEDREKRRKKEEKRKFNKLLNKECKTS